MGPNMSTFPIMIFILAYVSHYVAFSTRAVHMVQATVYPMLGESGTLIVPPTAYSQWQYVRRTEFEHIWNTFDWTTTISCAVAQ